MVTARASLWALPVKMCIRDRYVARRRAQAITDAQFAAWSAEAKKLRTQAYKTGMHEEAFRLQLDELMENIKGE